MPFFLLPLAVLCPASIPVPELPEVETVRCGLNQVTLHQPILGTDILLARTIGLPETAATFPQRLQGASIQLWQRRGKYLIAALCAPQVISHSQETESASGGWLGVHLRMTGQLLWLQASEPLHQHARVRFLFAGDRELRFVDQRTFGRIWWVPPEMTPYQSIPGLAHMGPEPLSEEFTVTYLEQALRHRRRPVKTALLDQTLVAGLGNIYVDEALFLSQIRPDRLCTELTPANFRKLQPAIQTVLQQSLAAGGTTFSTFRAVTGINGNYGGIARVYGRKGKPCHTCQTPIERLRLAGRSCHFCPTCQG